MTTIQLTITQTQVLQHALDHNSGRIDWFPDSVKGGARHKVLAGLFNRALVTCDGTDHFVAAEGYDALGLPRPTAALLSEVVPFVADPEMEAAVANVEAQWAQEATSETAAVAQSDVELDVVESATVQDDNATGCDERLADTAVPATEIDATRGQPLPASTPAEQPPIKPIRTREHSKQATIIGMLQRAEGATIAQICEATGWQAHTVRGTFAGAFKKKLGMTITSDKTQGGVRTYRAAA